MLKCAIIGCGRIGCGFKDFGDGSIRTHAMAYMKNPQTELIALCDVDDSKLKTYSKKFKIKNSYNNHIQMFKELDLDILSICTLSNTHLKLVRDAAQYGIKAIFLEKPISNSLKNTREIINICKKNDIVLTVNHQRRFDSFYSSSLKNFIHRQIMGTPQLANVHYGGGIANMGSHTFDLLRLLFGDVKSVNANYSKNRSPNKKDPNLDIELEFENNFKCFLNALDLTNYGIFELDIFGTKGRLKINLITNETEYSKISLKKYQDYKRISISPLPFSSSKYAGYDISQGLVDLIKCIKNNTRPLSSGNEGYKTLELIIACMTSVKQNKKITVPLKKYDYIVHSK